MPFKPMSFTPNSYYIPKSERGKYIPNPSMARTKVVRQFKKRVNPYAGSGGPINSKIPRIGDTSFLVTDAEINRAYDAAMTAVAAATRASKNVRSGGFIGKDVNYLDCFLGESALVADTAGAEKDPSTGCNGCLSAPAVGNGPTNREGNKILITNVLVNGQIVRSAAADQADVPRGISGVVSLVLDKQTNGAQLNSEDVYQAAGSSNASTALRNLQYTKRFEVLATHKFYIPPPVCQTDGTNTMSTGEQRENFILSKGLNMHVNFTTGTTADVANVVDNSLHVVAFADEAGTNPNVLKLCYDSRIRFLA